MESYILCYSSELSENQLDGLNYLLEDRYNGTEILDGVWVIKVDSNYTDSMILNTILDYIGNDSKVFVTKLAGSCEAHGLSTEILSRLTRSI